MYDNEGRFFDFIARIIEKDLRFESLIVDNGYYNEFERLFMRKSYDLKNYQIGHLFVDKTTYAPADIES
jgi:hypothetical protein